MGSKVFAKQLIVIVLSTAVVFLSACSEIVELPEIETQTPQTTEQESSLKRPINIDTSANSATETESQTPEVSTQPSTTPTDTSTTTGSTEPQEREQAESEQPEQQETTVSTTPTTEPQLSPEPSEQETEVSTTPVVGTESTQPQTSPEPAANNPTQPEPETLIEPTATTSPVTSEPVTSEPVTSEPVTSEPVTSNAQPLEPVSQAGIWQPKPGTTWQWQLSGTLDLSLDVEMYDIDLFDTKQSVIDQLHAEGRIVICYFSAGSLEPWRIDANKFPTEVIGSKMSSWDEYWLDISKIDQLTSIMTARLDLAVEKGCDGVEPDNIDAYQNNTGFALTTQDQLNYNIFLAEEAHKRGLSIGLKNSLELVIELEPYFDWALNESCFQWNECHLLQPFIDNDKAVFGVEYSASVSEFCDLVNSFNYDFLKKDYDLKAPAQPCRIIT